MANQLNSETFTFLNQWHQIMLIMPPILVVLAIIVYIFYQFKYRLLPDPKSKYDFIAEYEIKFHIVSHILIALAILCISNTYGKETVKLSMVWFFVRFFITICIATLYIYVTQLILKYYYPKKQQARMKKLRYLPRINSANGNEMKLLSEEGEDAYLVEGMQAEEAVFSVDYDVWIDIETGDTKIEKYEGKLTALECDRCGFQTLKLYNEEIIKEADDYNDGELLKEYKCSYCKRERRKTINLSKTKTESDFKLTENTKFVENPLGEKIKVTAIKIEIFSNKNDVHNFEFQNLKEAGKFLKEFSFEKITKKEKEEKEEKFDDYF